MATRPSDPKGSKPALKLTDADAGVDLTSLAVVALDSQGKVLTAAPVGKDGQFELAVDSLSSASRIVVAPAPKANEAPNLENAVPISVRDFASRLKTDDNIFEIDKSRWGVLFPIRRCASGSMEHCYPYPYVLADIEARALSSLQAQVTSIKSQTLLEDRARIGIDSSFLPYRCYPLCDGEVEVFKRTCCCTPYIYRDPRILEIIRDLERIVETIPIPKPGPDPAPFQRLAGRTYPLIDESGTLNESTINAASDLHALKTLPPSEQLAYLEARPYLRCWRHRCGAATRVGRGFLQPDGTFHICWNEPITIQLPFCHQEFAFKVTQVVNGVPVVIYDGVAAHQWFDNPNGVELHTYNPNAQSCSHGEPIPVDGAAALLLDIGLTDAWHLKTPDADGPLSVATPSDFNDGLIWPGPEANRSLNLNLGGTLSLLYGFTESLRSVAKYYRVSVCRADASGNPTGARHYFADNLAWYYLVFTSSGLEIQTQPLGPQTVGPNNGLYLIPYRADHEYKSNQFHAYINTAAFPEGRYLLTLEVFNAAGQRLHPNGTTINVDPGDVAGAFTFNRWYQETGPTAVVPYGALTHMLWWDNRPVVADIVDLRQNGVGSDAQCQFLSGPGTSQFSMGFRAYHPEPLFMQGYNSYWRRGLGGGSGGLGSGGTNAGQPPAPPAVSNAVDFEDMLTPTDRKCAFSVNLDVWSKTNNGFGRLGLDAHDQAAFAVEIP